MGFAVEFSEIELLKFLHLSKYLVLSLTISNTPLLVWSAL